MTPKSIEIDGNIKIYVDQEGIVVTTCVSIYTQCVLDKLMIGEKPKIETGNTINAVSYFGPETHDDCIITKSPREIKRSWNDIGISNPIFDSLIANGLARVKISESVISDGFSIVSRNFSSVELNTSKSITVETYEYSSTEITSNIFAKQNITTKAGSDSKIILNINNMDCNYSFVVDNRSTIILRDRRLGSLPKFVTFGVKNNEQYINKIGDNKYFIENPLTGNWVVFQDLHLSMSAPFLKELCMPIAFTTKENLGESYFTADKEMTTGEIFKKYPIGK